MTQQKTRRCLSNSGRLLAGVSSLALGLAPITPVLAQTTPRTPIQHVIVIIGENHSFDEVFATYTPATAGQTVSNLLSKGIVNADGTPGPNFALAAQRQGSQTGAYQPAPTVKSPYRYMVPAMTDGAPGAVSGSSPPFNSLALAQYAEPYLLPADLPLLTTGATGLPSKAVDTRVPNATTLPNGPYPISNSSTYPYDAYRPSPVHRFYQMWQQTDCSLAHATTANPSGCLNDLFPWVESTIGAGNNGSAQPANFTNQTTGEGSTAMGFLNVAHGDAPYFLSLANTYTMSDNFHQSIDGGTGANHIGLGSGLAFYYEANGQPATPPSSQIENPNSQPGTNNYWVQDGYSGRQLLQLLRSYAAGRRAGFELSGVARVASRREMRRQCVLSAQQL